MLAGIAMGIEQHFTLEPAHAHLNLIGGVLHARQGARLAPHDRRDPVSGRRRRRILAGG